MKGARLGALVLAVAAIAVALVMIAQHRRQTEGPTYRQDLLLLTSLPLLFGEQFSLQQPSSQVMTALKGRYTIVPISISSAPELKKGRLLLMAQPRAQRPEDLVALDRWVRDGGRVLLLADPMLEWPSERSLGDALRPPPMFADTGLLAHWGLRLDAPDERGPRALKLGGYEVATASPGALFGRCNISNDRLVAHCRVGKGAATVIADADLLNAEGLDSPSDHNADAVLAELALLERK